MQQPPNQPPYPPQGPPQGPPFGGPPFGGPPQGPPPGVPFGYQGYPQGYRPPPQKSGGGGTVIAILLVVFLGLPVLAGALFGFLRYKARSAISNYHSTYEADQKRIDDISAKLTAGQTPTGHNACVKSVSDKIAKTKDAKPPPPKTIPTGAALVCATDGWDRSCSLPDPLTKNGVFAPAVPCNDATGAALTKLQQLSSDKPYAGSGDSQIDPWAKKVDAALAEFKTADAAAKAPDTVAVMTASCTTTALATFNNNSTGEQRILEANSCEVAVIWVDASGSFVGRVSANGSGKPSASDLAAPTLDETQLNAANAESERNALNDGWTQLAKRLDTMKKGGTPAPGPAAPPAPGPATPPKAPTPPASTPKPPASTPKPPTTPPKKK